jgi:hypothetical protein
LPGTARGGNRYRTLERGLEGKRSRAMTLVRRLGKAGVALLILNEIRGVMVVAALLSGGSHALAATPHLHAAPFATGSGDACRLGLLHC